MESNELRWKDRRLVLFLCCLHIVSAGIFLFGFLSPSTNILAKKSVAEQDVVYSFRPSSTDDTGIAYTDLPPGSSDRPSKKMDKLVLFLIDALRWDFVFGNESSIPFLTRKLANGQAKGYVARACTPTVTLPRLKALLSGTIPAFSDIIFNFGSSEFADDNLITRLRDAGNRIVFYGDDTWLKLFPLHFHRSEGVSSFFATDYTEVDLNVTRNVEKELQKDDWDVMILHYLGLDHIGHSVGPKSHLLPLKLDEMSEIIERIYRYLETQGGNNLMVVFGDHGMTDAGNHGGSSTQETDTAMVFLSPSAQMAATKPPAAYDVAPISKINQVDLCSTLALLKQVPIPANNIGSPVFAVLRQFLTPGDMRKAMCILDKQISAHGFTSDEERQLTQEFPERKANCICDLYLAKSTDILSAESYFATAAELLSSRVSTYGLRSMCLGILGILICFLGHLLLARRLSSSSFSRSHAVMLAALLFHAGSFGASSFIEEEHQMWYYWMSSTLLFLAITSSRNTAPKFVALLVIHRLARDWNRTGNKWLDVPDIGDWLREPENRPLLTASAVTSVILMTFLTEKPLRYSPAFLVVALFHLFQLQALASTVHGLVIAGLFWERFSTRRIRAEVLRDTSIVCMALITRSHNLPLLFLVVAGERLLRNGLTERPTSPVLITFVYQALSWSGFFYLGNSNALSSVDVAPGFVGIPFYFAPLHGLLIFVHTYFGPLFGFLSWRAFMRSVDRKSSFLLENLVLASRSMLLISAYCNAFLQRHHTFVWSVFAPKVLYEFSHSFLLCFLQFVITLNER